MTGGGLGTSMAAKGAALASALAVHVALAWVLLPDERIDIERSTGGEAARLGSFADLAAGTLRPERATDTLAAQSRVGPPVQHGVPERIEATTPEDRRQAASGDGTAQGVDAKPPARAATPPRPPAALVPERADGTLAASPRAGTEPDAMHPETEEAEAQDPAPPPERIVATAPDDTAVARSLRPVRRSDDLETRRTRARAASPQTDASPQGDAPRAARSGTAEASRDAATERRGTQDGTATTQGSAAARNYPGQIQAKLSRTRKPPVPERGLARIRLTISASGGIASLDVVQSSGSAAVDRAALRFVQSAAPFPAPPAGARRTFTIPLRFAP